MSLPWYVGEKPPDAPPSQGWEVQTVAQRGVPRPITCVATGDEISPGQGHLYVTAQREKGGYRDEFEHYVIVDEAALKDWLGYDE